MTRRPAPLRALAALAVAGAVLLAKGAAMRAAGLNGFGVLHVLWLDLVVVVPLAGLLALVLLRGRRARAARAVAILALLMAPLGAYASFVEPSRLVVERATVPVPAARAGDAPLRIGVVSDLQFPRVRGHEREAVDRLMAERPDLVLVAGDVHQGSGLELEQARPEIRRLLGRLRAPGGVFLVQGDSDALQELEPQTAGTAVRPLVDDVARVRVRDRTVTIAGVRRDFAAPSALAAVDALERRGGEGDIRILLAHRPDPVLDLRRGTRIDLVVAGHTHGGQVQLPLLGPLTVASRVSREVGAGGLHDVGGGRRIYVTRGVGVERGQAPRLRLGSVPEVSVLTVR